MLLCRCDRAIPDGERRKIALFCNVREEAVIPALDVDTIYQVPVSYHEQGFDEQVCAISGCPRREPELARWQKIVDRIRASRRRSDDRRRRQIHQPARQL